MKAEEYTNLVKNKLLDKEFKFSNASINGYDATIGFRTYTTFKFFWGVAQSRIYIIVAEAEVITKDTIQEFSKKAFEYSRSQKKLVPPGILLFDYQQNVISIAVLVSSNIEQNAIEWVQNNFQSHFWEAEEPVLFDLKNEKTYYFIEPKKKMFELSNKPIYYDEQIRKELLDILSISKI